jgi:hypothetical protein
MVMSAPPSGSNISEVTGRPFRRENLPLSIREIPPGGDARDDPWIEESRQPDPRIRSTDRGSTPRTPCPWQLPQAALKSIHGYAESTGNVAGEVFVGRPRVEDDDVRRPRTPQEFLHRHRLHRGPVAEVIADQAVELGKLTFSHGANASAQVVDLGVGEPVVHEQSILTRNDERSLAQCLEMLGRVGER